MCPACITTVALMVAGTASTGGLTALVVKKLRAKTRVPRGTTPPPNPEVQNGSSENRIES